MVGRPRRSVTRSATYSPPAPLTSSESEDDKRPLKKPKTTRDGRAYTRSASLTLGDSDEDEGGDDVDDTVLQLRDGATPPGLRNIGNTCYLNSILQYLFTIEDVRDQVMQAAAIIQRSPQS